jgi:hypothetical protein
MLRKSMLAAAIIALTPALAIAAPANVKTTHAAIIQPVKAQKVGLVKHHKAKLTHKMGMQRHHKAKAAIVKS